MTIEDSMLVSLRSTHRTVLNFEFTVAAEHLESSGIEWHFIYSCHRVLAVISPFFVRIQEKLC